MLSFRSNPLPSPKAQTMHVEGHRVLALEADWDEGQKHHQLYRCAANGKWLHRERRLSEDWRWKSRLVSGEEARKLRLRAEAAESELVDLAEADA